MFKERIKMVFEALEVTTKDFAEFSKCDRSNISHLKSGRRRIKKSGKAIRRLVENISLYAEKNGKVAVLCKVIGSNDIHGRELESEIVEWLFETYNAEKTEKIERTRHIKNNSEFARKFSLCIELAGISNIKLAHLISVDPSLISRYKSGQRVPSDNKIAKVLGIALLKYIYLQNNIEEICHAMGVDIGIFKTPEDLQEYFVGWLCDFKGKNNIAVEKFLKELDNISEPGGNIDIMHFGKAAERDIITENIDKYRGNVGLRRAALRFLRNAVKNKYKELWLYSDQNMDWITEDSDFFAKCFSLLKEAVECGANITIVHNADRGIETMLSLIKSWMPLYLTGGIKSFYSTESNGGRFAHTIFTSPDNAVVFGCCPVGCENTTEYIYSVQQDDISYYEEFYKGIMKKAKELIKIYPHENSENISYINNLDDIHIIKNKFSLGTAPKSLIDKIAENEIEEDSTRKQFLDEWQRKSEHYNARTESGNVSEVISLVSDSIYLDSESVSVKYTNEYIAEHIEHILSLHENGKKYHLAILPYTLLGNNTLIITDKNVTVRRSADSAADIVLSHPLICTAFAIYADDLAKQYAVSRRNLEAILKIISAAKQIKNCK